MKTWALIAIAVLGFSGSFAFADARICIDGICIGNDRGDRGGRGGHDGRPGYGGADYITCESIGNRYNDCRFDNFRVRGVRLVQQHSRSSCSYGRNWGFNWNSVWVDNGCRATFKIVRY